MSTFRHRPPDDQQALEETTDARVMLQKAYLAAEDFLAAFERSRQGKAGGNSTDAEQDQLRAMLVFAAAGLDAMVKRLVRSALPAVLAKRVPVTEEKFKAFVIRRAKQDPDFKFLADALVSPNSRERLIEAWMDDLTTGSQQSTVAVETVAGAFDLDVRLLNQRREVLKKAFIARNQIVHEMDLDFAANRARRQRKKVDMKALTQEVLSTASALLTAIEAKLGAPSA